MEKEKCSIESRITNRKNNNINEGEPVGGGQGKNFGKQSEKIGVGECFNRNKCSEHRYCHNGELEKKNDGF
jgi:hypothetical protein